MNRDEEPLLVVAVCDGHRCRALRALRDDQPSGSPGSSSLIREAVRTSRHTMMLSTTCLGPCAHAAVVAVGRAFLEGSNAVWLAPPVCWGSTETDAHATELAQWISTTARGPGPPVPQPAPQDREA